MSPLKFGVSLRRLLLLKVVCCLPFAIEGTGTALIACLANAYYATLSTTQQAATLYSHTRECDYLVEPADGNGVAQRDEVRGALDRAAVWIEFVVQNGVVFSSGIHYYSIWRDKPADYGGDFQADARGGEMVRGACVDHFALNYDVIAHEIVTHVVLVSIRSDRQHPIPADDPVLLGMIRNTKLTQDVDRMRRMGH